MRPEKLDWGDCSGDIKSGCITAAAFSDSYRIQTCNLLIRSQMLYSVELMSLNVNNRVW